MRPCPWKRTTFESPQRPQVIADGVLADLAAHDQACIDGEPEVDAGLHATFASARCWKMLLNPSAVWSVENTDLENVKDGHLAEYLKLAITTAKPATLKKVKIDDGRLRIDNEKKLDLISS